MDHLTAAADHHLARLVELIELDSLSVEQQSDLRRAFGLSDFIANSLYKQPELVSMCFEQGLFEQNSRCLDIQTELSQCLADCHDETKLQKLLRQFRRKHMLIIAWRELLGKSDLAESLEHTSCLADELISQSSQWLYHKQCQELGEPRSEEGIAQPFYILAMGKLGGKELNFSSDIDLIFTFPENGETHGGRRELSNQQFFIRLGQRVIAALNQPTVDGFVFRVDMRLRPFGESGPLVMSFAAFEDYYQTQGRDWERYAMVKARVLGPTSLYKDELETMLRPFVFRRYIDFSAIQSLRQMKAMISAEVRRKGLKDNIKLGAGGIREIEFVAQAFQLIRGGREPLLQQKGLRQTLQALIELDVMPSDRVNTLLDSYHFLRRTENVLQQIDDKQTQTLPENELDKQRLITALGFTDWDSFYQQLTHVMSQVNQEFDWVVGENEQQDDELDSDITELWLHDLEQDEALAVLAKFDLGEEEALKFYRIVVDFKKETQRRAVGPRGRENLKKLMPLLTCKALTKAAPVTLIERLVELLTSIMTRTAYLELLNENHGALKQLVRLCDASARIAAQLARHPILLDELLDPQHLYNPTPFEQYKSDLRQYMLRIPEEDMEQQMEGLRQYKQIQRLRISAADIAGALPLMKVSDHLTYLAEAIMEYVVNIAWQQMIEKYGEPSNIQGSERRGFAVIGYGKLGGIELGYGSDLDVVFLHDTDVSGYTNGQKEIDNKQFYLRLGQRILHLFSTRTSSGILYEVDMRLRPQGDSGLLVSSMAAYQQYLEQEAWTWEHQSLVRARCVYGDEAIVEAFTQIRLAILAKQREINVLAKDVVDMRQKMRDHLLRADETQFDLKQSPGGMVDIEFMAQFLVLANTQTMSAMARWSDNIRIFETCVEQGLLSPEQGKLLSESYCHIRDAAHRLTLNQQTRVVSADRYEEDRAKVIDLWDSLVACHYPSSAE
ncbi:bifunctional [glutamate--ammonia ligase]-adenylyl-L-tyrosine phosphorylase/[glutamate--ammonia-ligase] adenylyltransferase [Motilimonas eburnea]|uniref:bifunctional [glutamate--ammonia ligase]-adenylyl-L-tyrosine phosphorylase/[glutamate--ammonia-ligase] adenylyltransferase n=1 Tax=Motilimonas eburnea TaxID=1737488 RepID=UPI001E4578F6|nr:bifunctional [glutamate--ammonia ligase]-adenylyl-L-tyrosine phosphorylase/[glutamate--ammonia-ligase] adenylyltransferase [Motilimonas eburnea]MCE2573511.1 bifunctional [glutamate--ammonia ligase]-adenylyl-L-tyrosine phosphorylase/[glutamate--ammonia-ligase] adenylyltransferase [Motilimonas eburnea]